MKITIEFERELDSVEDTVKFMNALMGIKGDNLTVKTEVKKEEKPAKVEEIVAVETPAEEEVYYTMDDAKSIASKVLKTNREEVMELIHSYGVKKLTELTDPYNIHEITVRLKEIGG